MILMTFSIAVLLCRMKQGELTGWLDTENFIQETNLRPFAACDKNKSYLALRLIWLLLTSPITWLDFKLILSSTIFPQLLSEMKNSNVYQISKT